MLKSPLGEIKHMLEAEFASKLIAEFQHPKLLRLAGKSLKFDIPSKFCFRKQNRRNIYTAFLKYGRILFYKEFLLRCLQAETMQSSTMANKQHWRSWLAVGVLQFSVPV